MAVTAVGVTVFYYLIVAVTFLLFGMGSGGDLPVSFFALPAVELLSGAITLSAVVAPLLFVSGITAWRVVPPSQRYGGAIGGLVAMGLAYLVAGVLGAVSGSVYAVATGGPLVGSVIGSVGIVFVAFLVSSWMAFPAGILTGTLYERSLND
ncbi:hypothetical protein EKH57_01760 [Halorubrum sp. BOL3-1]|uniref:hypothetical protein n=1 Tax=Halorubrum sp. BOL3-1 TaxID=2497325 RepID=UPI0010051EC2|nr:hypothetical protein [Halorubrum sp. BOL3-1]QAU11589.1 hypothetical protein EKH57_01760 [Halorubrum sp. BOL3-1]